MFGGARLKVIFTYERTCFGYISSKYSLNCEQSQCVQVLFNDKKILLWVMFSNTISENQIACNPTFSRLIGLEEGTEVFVSSCTDVRILNELYIDPDSPDDQDILEHNIENLQLNILDQLRLVVASQKAVVWISPSLPIVFTPKQTGILIQDSKVIVKIDAFRNVENGLKSTTDININKDQKFNNIGKINSTMLEPYFNVPQKLVLRALPIDSDGKKNLIHPYIVFIHEDLLDNKYKELTVILAKMTPIPFLLINRTEENENSNQIEHLCVEIVPIDNVVYKSLSREVYNKNIPTVLISRSLNVIANIQNGMKIIFSVIGDIVKQPEHIEIITYTEKTQSELDVIEKFKSCVVENTHSGKKFLINGGLIKQNPLISCGFLKFKLQPENIEYTVLNSESFRECTVSAKCLSDTENVVLPKPVISMLDYDYKNYCRTMKSVQNLVQNIVTNINFEVQREASFNSVSEIKSNVLLTGQSGSGKTAICHIVQKDLTLWSTILHCRSFKGRKDITEELSKVLLRCREHSPAVLICDDVDALLPPDTDGASPSDVAYFHRQAAAIKQMLQTCKGVCVLMTALSVKSLHPTIRNFNGKPLFTAHFDIPEIDQTERAELFRHVLSDRIRDSFLVEDDDVTRMAMDTGGCTVRGALDYLNQRIFKAVKKRKSQPDVKHRLVEELAKDEDRCQAFDVWGPVGGMEDVKRELTECIFWPLMYPALFPERGCGVLLYGPPGSGKSHVGSCLARLANMNLIVVKGPELLSKYIGQSEKAVRDVFDKAEMQRPCILFFDEFDSLAPKRGHDSTGVTDRVVNQLLARLDGAEGGAGGPVLAATSRPDLVDPALLRAGRLQRHVYCAPPDQNGRYEVLRTLSSSVSIDEGVDLRALADRTAGYSPADLRALLVTAQLGRLEQCLVTSEDRNLESIVVHEEDIAAALEETKPSLSPEQMLFYDMIYKRFRGEPLSVEQSAMARVMQKQRVTLA